MNGLSPAQTLYLPTVINSVCEEITLVPWTQVLISMTFTLLFFVILQRLFPGTGMISFILTGTILVWYSVCLVIASYRDYTFWSKKPDYRVFARCSLNKEYNDRLGLKIVVINILSQKFVSCMLARDYGNVSIKAFRFIMNLVKLVAAAALIARGVATLGASVGMGWAFIYMFIFTGLSTHASAKLQLNPGMLWVAAAEKLQTGSEEEQSGASALMGMAEAGMIESGVDVPSGAAGGSNYNRHVETEGAAEEKEEPAAAPAAPLSSGSGYSTDKLKFFAEHADKSTLIPRILFIIFYSISCYSCIISWDWRYGGNGISYGEAWSAFDSFRPTAKQLYSNSGKLTAEQSAYIASTWS